MSSIAYTHLRSLTDSCQAGKDLDPNWDCRPQAGFRSYLEPYFGRETRCFRQSTDRRPAHKASAIQGVWGRRGSLPAWGDSNTPEALGSD